MKSFKVISFIVVAVSIVSSLALAEVVDRIVAVVNDDIITLSELNRAFEPYAKRIEATYTKPDKESVLKGNKEALLQEMVNQLLIEQTAKKAGADFSTVKEEDVTGVVNDMLVKHKVTLEEFQRRLEAEGSSLENLKKEIKGQILRMRLLRREVQSRIVITDEEIGAYYQEHRDAYEGKEAARIRQIFLPAAADAPATQRQQARELAQQIRERVIQGESFEQLCAQYSGGPAANQGGDVGFVERGVILPPVEKAAFALPIGKLSDVIETDIGYHLIVVTDRRGGGVKPIDEVRHEIKARIEEDKIAKKYEEWIQELRKKSYIDIRL